MLLARASTIRNDGAYMLSALPVNRKAYSAAVPPGLTGWHTRS